MFENHRIAILGTRGYPSYYGGFETLVRWLAPYLVQRGHEVVVYGRGEGWRAATESIDGVTVVNTWRLETKSTSTFTYGLTASSHLVRHPTDAALLMNVANGYHIRRLQRAGIPVVVNVDGIEWEREKWGSLARRVFLQGAELVARRASTLVYDSRAIGVIWEQQFGRKGLFIPYGAPVLNDVGTDLLRERGLPEGGYVLVVARIVPENNVDLLLDAVDLMAPRPEVIVVGDSNYEHPTVDRLRSLASIGKVRALGHIDNQELLNELWAHAGVYWHGHSVGGTNPALLQALGAGSPTLALDTPFNREVIGNNDQLVESDASLLAARIEGSLSTAEPLAKEFARRGQSIVEERYSWDTVCEQYLEMFEGLIARATKPA